jgi:hypothetical protein
VAALVFLGPMSQVGWSQQAVNAEPAGREQAAYPDPPSREEAAALAVAGDVFFTAPGKFLTCVGSIGLWAVTMAVTFGTQYRDAAKVVVGGCGGEWVAEGKDIREAFQPEK